MTVGWVILSVAGAWVVVSVLMAVASVALVRGGQQEDQFRARLTEQF
jgi:hypothetical protein